MPVLLQSSTCSNSRKEYAFQENVNKSSHDGSSLDCPSLDCPSLDCPTLEPSREYDSLDNSSLEYGSVYNFALEYEPFDDFPLLDFVSFDDLPLAYNSLVESAIGNFSLENLHLDYHHFECSPSNADPAMASLSAPSIISRVIDSAGTSPTLQTEGLEGDPGIVSPANIGFLPQAQLGLSDCGSTKLDHHAVEHRTLSEAKTALPVTCKKETFLSHLGMPEDVYKGLLVQTADTWRQIQANDLNFKQSQPLSSVDWTSVTERAKDLAIEALLKDSAIEGRRFLDLAAPGTRCANWICQWFLYRHCRNRYDRRSLARR